MIITCGECDSSFVLADHLVKASGSKVRCSKCKNVFIAYPDQSQPKAKSKKIVEPEIKMVKPTVENNISLDEDPDLTKAVAAIKEEDLEFTDTELGVDSSFKFPAKKSPAVAESAAPAAAATVAAAAAVAAAAVEKQDEEEILDFADFELDMDEEGLSSEAVASEKDLDLDFESEPSVSSEKIEDDLDLQLDSDEEELDFSDLELELDGKEPVSIATEVVEVKMSKDEIDSADTMLVEELDLSGLDEEESSFAEKDDLPDFNFDMEEADEKSEADMIDDELDFSDLERELDGISKDEPATVDELDLNLDSEDGEVESETIMMDEDELDFSEFELEMDEAKATSDKTDKIQADSAMAEDDELDFSGLADILESDQEAPPARSGADEELELELDMDLDPGSKATKAEKTKSDEEELDFSDLEDLLDGLEESPSEDVKDEDIHLELDEDIDEMEDFDSGTVKGKAAAHHADDDLDFSDVEAMLGSDDVKDEELNLDMGDSDDDFDLKMEKDEDLMLSLDGDEDSDIELELDMGDDAQTPSIPETAEEKVSSLSDTMTIDKPKTDIRSLEKKKPVSKPKRKSSGSGMGIGTVIAGIVAVLFILFGVYMAKDKIGLGHMIPKIAPLENLKESISRLGIPGVSSFLKAGDKDIQGKNMLKTSGISGKEIPNSKMGRVYVISGFIENQYPETRNSISLVAKLFGSDKKALQITIIYAGNIISDHELSSIDEAGIKRKLQNRLGDNGINAKVKPNQTIPFMAVFPIRSSQSLSQFTVEAAGSNKGEAVR